MSNINGASFTNDPVKWTKENPGKAIGGGITVVAIAGALVSCDPKSEQAPNITTDTSITNPYICEVQEGTITGTNVVLVGDPLDPNSIAFTTDPNDHSRVGGSNIPYRLKNLLNPDDNSLSVHFITNQSLLDEGDKEDLRLFAENLNSVITGTTTLVIEGNADARGNEGRNDYLSNKRAEQVRDFISPLLNDEITIQLASFGANNADQLPTSTHEERLAHRPFRKVTLIPTENIITRALEQSPADIFLLDASGSMIGDSWNAVTNFDYPDTAKILTFTTANLDGCAEELGTQSVNGSTPLYISLLEIVSNTENTGKTITLLSDGDDTEGGNIHEIIRLAQENKIVINTIGVEGYNKDSLTRIATETGGDDYFQL